MFTVHECLKIALFFASPAPVELSDEIGISSEVGQHSEKFQTLLGHKIAVNEWHVYGLTFANKVMETLRSTVSDSEFLRILLFWQTMIWPNKLGEMQIKYTFVMKEIVQFGCLELSEKLTDGIGKLYSQILTGRAHADNEIIRSVQRWCNDSIFEIEDRHYCMLLLENILTTALDRLVFINAWDHYFSDIKAAELDKFYEIAQKKLQLIRVGNDIVGCYDNLISYPGEWSLPKGLWTKS